MALKYNAQKISNSGGRGGGLFRVKMLGIIIRNSEQNTLTVARTKTEISILKNTFNI